MKRIVQQDWTGCGVACAAILAGKTYAQVKKKALAAGILEPGRAFYTSSAEVRELLAMYGVSSSRGRRATRWDLLPSPSVVGINADSEGNWHWVVYVDGYVLDPYKPIKSRRRVDFSRMRLNRCIEVRP